MHRRRYKTVDLPKEWKNHVIWEELWPKPHAQEPNPVLNQFSFDVYILPANSPEIGTGPNLSPEYNSHNASQARCYIWQPGREIPLRLERFHREGSPRVRGGSSAVTWQPSTPEHTGHFVKLMVGHSSIFSWQCAIRLICGQGSESIPMCLFKFTFFICVGFFCLHLCLYTICMQCPEEGITCPESGVSDSCELSSMGAKNWTRVLRKSNQCSYAPNQLSSPFTLKK